MCKKYSAQGSNAIFTWRRQAYHVCGLGVLQDLLLCGEVSELYQGRAVLGNNQPNITHSMNRLESQLNCVLFIRSNRGVTLTPEGEMLYSRIASAAVQIQDAEEELSASATLEHGTISISATETALNIYLSKKLRDFHTEYPGIRLRISNHSTPQAVQAVKNGEVDFAIVSTPAEIESGLKMVELKPFYEVLVGGRTFTALASQSLTLKELRSYPLISLSDESVTRSLYRQFFLDHGAVLKPDTEAATTDQMLTLVKSELGLAFVRNPWRGIAWSGASWCSSTCRRSSRPVPSALFTTATAR